VVERKEGKLQVLSGSVSRATGFEEERVVELDRPKRWGKRRQAAKGREKNFNQFWRGFSVSKGMNPRWYKPRTKD